MVGHASFLSTTTKIILVLVVGFFVSVGSVLLLDAVYTNALKQRASSFSLGVNKDDVMTLRTSFTSGSDVVYQETKEQLADLKALYPEVRFIYLMAQSDGRVIFLADSEPTTSHDYSPRGQVYSDVPADAVALFTNGSLNTVDLITDEWGTWYSAFAPVVDEDGNVIAVLGVDVPVTSYAGSILGIGSAPLLIAGALSALIYVYDASRRRQLEALRFQVELSSIASHEVGVPLRGLAYNVEALAADAGLSDGQRQIVSRSQEDLRQLQEGANNVIRLADVASGVEAKPALAEINLHDVVRSAVDREASTAEEKEVHLVLAESWPEMVRIHGDAMQLQRVFTNLLADSLEYTHRSGYVTVSYSQVKNEHVAIIDIDGVIPKEVLSSRLKRKDLKTRVASQRVGLNLFVARTTLERYKGSITVESTPKGTRFVVRIPAR